MGFADLAFLIFAASTILSGLGVILAKNPVHSVLMLILAFISTAGLFVLMGAEYLAFLLVVVYVGAVAVLFLFVVMMLDVDFAELRADYMRYAPLGGVVAVALVALIGLAVGDWHIPEAAVAARTQPTETVLDVTGQEVGNAEQLGMVLYTKYVHFFQIAGLILLVAMVGAITLTFRERRGIKTQDVGAQVGRRREDAVEVVSVPTGRGI
ncbi:NADH-quinone oxidoreductase subunit J [Parvularcula lutaonensis]|uniref:NADH-quinone oxidoreductase subunit J n=1 Tax=Parvularcula lutaonensis TaxID=491923 RepID=A0ABV7M8K5_9PROT|nr:NADH-quinone oxidoreductase subunit J [Parvularcula lutaonensis]GGY43081.1 NADH:ubiquinone oxidoreductase subunit J [Parvularcula lutaonensis]